MWVTRPTIRSANFFATGPNNVGHEFVRYQDRPPFHGQRSAEPQVVPAVGQEYCGRIFYGNEADVNSYGLVPGSTAWIPQLHPYADVPEPCFPHSWAIGHAWTTYQRSGGGIPGHQRGEDTRHAAVNIGLSGVNEFPTIQFGSGGYNSEGLGMIGYQGWALMHYASETAHLVGSLGSHVGSHELKVGGDCAVIASNFLQVGAPAGNYSFSNAGTASLPTGGWRRSLRGLLIGYDEGWGEYEIPLSPATQNYQYGGLFRTTGTSTSA